MYGLEKIFGLLIYSTLFPGTVFTIFLALIIEWVERKIEARMENRMGPSYNGPFGIFQPFLDFLKLLHKEEIDIDGGDNELVNYAIAFSLIFSIFPMLFIPWFNGINLFSYSLNLSFEGDLILVLVLLAFSSSIMALAGIATNSVYPYIGSSRLLHQSFSYEIPIFLSYLVPAVITGKLSIKEIYHSIIPSLLNHPIMIFFWLIAFVITLLSLQAELEKNPFTIPEAETEIVAGYSTEFTGRRLAFIHLIHEIHETIIVILTFVLFFGHIIPVNGILEIVMLILGGFLILILVGLFDTGLSRIKLFSAQKLLWFTTPLILLVLSLTFLYRGVL
ncbi:MAG: NADH-quinone oxidoreductase subunit H [Thermoproteales archaeon]|nr:NADH-quinone oxidoreductase subunit H [Thermoproteales archaeon]